MVEVQKIACVNNAGFVMSFLAQTKGAESLPTGNYPIDQTRVIDLADTPFREGMEFWPLVSAVLGKTKAASDHIVYRQNGQTATYQVTGATLTYSINYVGQGGGSLPDWPAAIPVAQYNFTNWSRQISVNNVWTCAPGTPADVVTACNWAVAHGFKVRPRGIMHGWSPLTVVPTDSADKMLLVDMTKALNGLQFMAAGDGLPSRVRTGAGATMVDLLSFLESQPGGGGAAPGFSFPHTPAPGHLTVGGVLAINAHGTAIPLPPNDAFRTGYGSMSNRIVEITAVTTDPAGVSPNPYALRTFKRGDADCNAFLVHLGRALIVEAVLEVVPNYNLRCMSYTNLPASTVFAAPAANGQPIPYSFGDFLARYGRVEVIWFPFTTNPWIHIWEVAADQPSQSRLVNGPYNYPFADNLDPTLQAFLRKGLGSGALGALTPIFGGMMGTATANGLDGKNFLGQDSYPPSRDIWGPSKNTLLYIQDSTLQVTANGYAVQMRKADVWQAVHDFTTQFASMLASYAAAGSYPINSALEIRVTGLDDPAAVGVPARTPPISSLVWDETARARGYEVALWLDVLTIPGTPGSDAFFTELEQWMLARFSAPAARLLPEWSKGWAYTAAGPWTSAPFMQGIRNALPGSGEQSGWAWQVQTLKKYDGNNLFSNSFLDTLFE